MNITKLLAERAGIMVEKLLSKLQSALLIERSAADLLSNTFVEVDDVDVLNATRPMRSRHLRHVDALLSCIKELGGRSTVPPMAATDIEGLTLFPGFEDKWRAGGEQLKNIVIRTDEPRTRHLTNLLAMEQSLEKEYEQILQVDGGKVAAIDRVLAPLLRHAREHARVLGALIRTQAESAEIERLTRSTERALATLDKHTLSISRLERLSEELYAYLVPLSLGLQTDDLELRRFVPIRVYVNRYDDELVGRLSSAVLRFADVLGIGVAVDKEAQSGSWFKRWIGKTKDVMTQPEVAERLKKGERAVELATLQSYQANVDKTQAEAAATLLQSLDQIPEAVVQIGSLLIIKMIDADSRARTFVRSLTQRELAAIERDPSVLKNPAALFRSLERHDLDVPRTEKAPMLEGPNSDDKA